MPAVPVIECVSVADCFGARREGPQYNMMQSATVLGLHDLTMALPAMTFPPVTGPRLVQRTNC